MNAWKCDGKPSAVSHQPSAEKTGFEPFALAAAILETTRRCLMDRDAGMHPLALVIARAETGDARAIWKAISYKSSEVTMEMEPDQGSKEWSVLLFSKEQTS